MWGSLRLTQSGGYTYQTYPMQADFFVTKSKVKQFALLKWFAEHKRGGERRGGGGGRGRQGGGDVTKERLERRRREDARICDTLLHVHAAVYHRLY